MLFVIKGNEQQPSAETESNNVEPRTGVKKEIPDVRPHQRNDNDRKPKQSQTRTVEAEINEVRGQNFSDTFPMLFFNTMIQIIILFSVSGKYFYVL